MTAIEKAVTITNNTNTDATPRWIYPVFLATNDGSAYDGSPYDPNDPANQDYRIYVGYKASNSQYYVGLPPGASVTFYLPEAMWDGGTIQLVTDTPQTETYFWSSGNPFNFHNSAPSTTFVQDLSDNGALLLYRGPESSVVGGIATSASSQLTEYTIRDESQTVIGKPTLDTSVDVDISYLDAMYLPVAEEAVLTKGDPQAGYIGTTITVPQFESTLTKFVSGANLGNYFYNAPENNVAWPQFNLTPTGNTPAHS